MLYVLLLASLAMVSQAQHYHPRAVYVNPIAAPVRYNVAPAPIDESPKPYSYSYSAPAEGGASSREETSDGSGRVTGSYTVNDEDGRQRVVEYVADEGGFRANIRTNEPGTANQSPADVVLESTAPEEAPVYSAPIKPAVVPVASPVINRIIAPTPLVAPAPLTYNIAPTDRGLYYNSLGHQHGYHGNRGLYSPYGYNHGYYGGLYNRYGGLYNHGHGGLYNHGHGGLYNHGHGGLYNHGLRNYYPGSRYYY